MDPDGRHPRAGAAASSCRSRRPGSCPERPSGVLDMTIATLEAGRAERGPGRASARTMHAAHGRPVPRSAAASPAPGCARRSRRIGEMVPLELTEVPTGTPSSTGRSRRSGTSATPGSPIAHGERVIDFQARTSTSSNYSAPVRRRLSLDELRPHLHTLPDHPTWVPYRTSYYAESWGFCLSQEALDRLPDGRVRGGHRRHARGRQPHLRRVRAPGRDRRGDPDLEPRLPPLARQRQPLRRRRRRVPRPGRWPRPTAATRTASCSPPARSARSPGWRATRTLLDRIRAGLVLACVGDPGPVVYKRSRRGDAEIDRAAAPRALGAA